MKGKSWKQRWNRTIGGSRAAAVIGKSPWQTQLDVYRQMRGETPLPDLSDNPDVLRGITFEAPMRRLLAKEIGEHVYPHNPNDFLRNEKYHHAHTLVDGWVGAKRTGTPVEIKLPRPQKVQRIAMEGLPEEYVIQAQHEMAVTAKPRLLFVVGCVVSMRLICQEIVADEAFIAELMRAESEFMRRVKLGEPPVVGETSALPAPTIPPPVDGAIVKIDTREAVAAARAYVEADELCDETDSLKRSARERLIRIAGDVDVFEVSDGNGLACRFYHREQAGRTSFDARAAIAADPALERFQRTGEPFRSFKMYQLNRR